MPTLPLPPAAASVLLPPDTPSSSGGQCIAGPPARSIADHGTLLCAMIGQRVYPPRLSSNLNSRETLSRVFFRRLTPTDSRSHQSGHIRMRHGPGFISPSRNLSCLATICRKLAGRRSVTNQSDVEFRNQSDYPIPGVLSLYESDGFWDAYPGLAFLSLSELWLAV